MDVGVVNSHSKVSGLNLRGQVLRSRRSKVGEDRRRGRTLSSQVTETTSRRELPNSTVGMSPLYLYYSGFSFDGRTPQMVLTFHNVYIRRLEL